MKYDFSGYATKNDLECSDGRTIRHGAFKGNHGSKVPLVWQHLDNSPTNIVGHALLENRNDGVYAYCSLNKSMQAQHLREIVQHKDVDSLSIRANQLVQRGGDVLKGNIVELSVVLKGANPGAKIDNIVLQHADGYTEESEEEAIMFLGDDIEIAHGDEDAPNIDEEDEDSGEEDITIREAFESMTDVQKQAVYALAGMALQEGQKAAEEQLSDEAFASSEEAQHGESENNTMHFTAFQGLQAQEQHEESTTLTHSQVGKIFEDAARFGSLKESVLRHADEYGIKDINMLFPDPKSVSKEPHLMFPSDPWVDDVLNGVFAVPFARFKTLIADVTGEKARALGYVTGKKKVDEVIKLAKREVSPTTIYKKQRLDRDDILDIIDFNVVAWLKMEMAMKLREELARAIVFGDGREESAEGKINEQKLRPIVGDDDLYAQHVTITSQTTSDLIDEIMRSQKHYKGAGRPKVLLSTSTLTDMLQLKDTTGRRIYANETDLAAAMRVSGIIEVPMMDGIKRKGRTGVSEESGQTYNVLAVLVNFSDYRLGTDAGGNTTFFDDFDISYNQYHYLLERRHSGMLVRPKTAIVIDRKA